MLRSLKDFDYEKTNVLEWMHNLARAFDNFLRLLTGGDKNFDTRARSTCRDNNIFEDLWPDRHQFLSQARRTILRGLDDETISRGDTTWCRRWLRMCCVSVERDELVGSLRHKVTSLRDRAARGEQIPLPGTNNLFP